jgi:Cu/Ag efflux protein CusF
MVISLSAIQIPVHKRRPTMKKITTLITALIVAFSMTAIAADKAPEVKPADVKPAQEKKTEEKKAHHRNHFYGEVKAVDAKAGTVTVSRGEKTFAADEKLLSGVKVGDKISVKFAEKDGQLTATGIKAAEGKRAHHKKKEAKKAEEKKAEEKKAEEKKVEEKKYRQIQFW